MASAAATPSGCRSNDRRMHAHPRCRAFVPRRRSNFPIALGASLVRVFVDASPPDGMTRCSSKKPAGGAGAPSRPGLGREGLPSPGAPSCHQSDRRSVRPPTLNRKNDTRALQAYLGHRSLQHTVRYTELPPIASSGSGRIEASQMMGVFAEFEWAIIAERVHTVRV